MTELVSLRPQRKIGTSRRALTGRLALGDSKAVEFESSLERDWLELLDFEPQVEALQVQPFSLFHEVDGAQRRYTPDVMAIWDRGGRRETVVYEVKYQDDLRENWRDLRPRFVAATRYCREQGWRFKIVSDKHIRTPKLRSVKFLRPYRRLDPNPAVQGDLLDRLTLLGPTSVRGLLEATYSTHKARVEALPYFWRLVANFQIEMDLDAPLLMTSGVRSPA